MSRAISVQPQLPPARTGSDVTTPIKLTALVPYLSGYDSQLQFYLVNGFTEGFAIGCHNIQGNFDPLVKNLQSAYQLPLVVDNKLKKELQLGRILGPYGTPPAVANYRISPLGVVPKKQPGQFRLIHHLSYPHGLSINDSIPSELASVTYATIQDAITFIQSADQTVFMAKVDIESAFRIIPILPADRPLLGFRWRGLYYMDAVLPMGCSSSCAIFETFSSALQWIAETKLHVTAMVHFLDDFLLLATSKSKCAADLNAFESFCRQTGVPLAAEKTIQPTTSLPFLGITLDTIALEARLPPDKLHQCNTLLTDFASRSKVTLKELQSLIGVLNFACSVIVPGRAFLRRLIDLTMGVSQPHHRIRLTQQAKLDIAVWAEFFQNFNGRSFFLNAHFFTGDFLKLYTDASGSIGYGAVCGKQWFYGTWPASWLHHNITTLELYPIVAAVVVWGDAWRNTSICFFTDNEALVSIINKQTSREPCVMTLLRKLVLTCLLFNISFTARHIAGRDNSLADKLSRLQVAEFRAMAPWSEEFPTAIPITVSPVGLGNL